MGKNTFSEEAYTRSSRARTTGRGPVTEEASQAAFSTGKLHELVDPAGYGVIRPSRPRFIQRDDGLWEMTIGTPVPIETRLDTTGSMGDNVDIAMRVLPKAFLLAAQMLPGQDPHVATGIFADIGDRFVLCRPQFEMLADKIVEQLTLMVPEGAGGDKAEDPHYGIFGAAYLVNFYLTRLELKSYDFTVSDAPARDLLSERQLRRIFGEDVFKKVLENGHQINQNDLPNTAEVVQDLLKRAHGFFLQVGNDPSTTHFWTRIYGADRVVILPSTEVLPQVQATIIGLTEGTLALDGVIEFLTANNVSARDAESILRSVSNIPIGAQAALPNFGKKPQAGDLFREKTDLWPISGEELAAVASSPAPTPESGTSGDPDWL